MGNSVDWCAVCVTFVALVVVVLVVCDAPFDVVAMPSAVGLLLTCIFVVLVFLCLSLGYLRLVVGFSIVSGGWYGVVWMSAPTLWGYLMMGLFTLA